MERSRVLGVVVIALLLSGSATAEIGSFSFSYSVTPVGSNQLDFALTSSTYGATTTTSYEGLSNTVYLSGSTYNAVDGTYGYRSTISLNSTTGPPYAMRLASNFSFSPLPPGPYWYVAIGQAWYWGYSTYYSTSTWIYPTYDYATGTAFVGVNVPTAGRYGVMALGLALALTGVFLLRRM